MKYLVTHESPPPPANTPRNTYIAIVRVMHGDADDYDNLEIEIPNYPMLERFLDCVIGMYQANVRDRTTRRSLPNYLEFFTSMPEDENEDGFRTYAERLNKLNSGWGEDYWPRDNQNHIDDCNFDGFRIFWYDANGVKCPVTIRLENGRQIHQNTYSIE